MSRIEPHADAVERDLLAPAHFRQQGHVLRCYEDTFSQCPHHWHAPHSAESAGSSAFGPEMSSRISATASS